MSKSKKLPVKDNIDQIKVGPFKPIKYYEANIDAPDNWFKTFEDIGRQVITSEQYINIGFNYVIKNAVDNEFKLESLKKYKQKK